MDQRLGRGNEKECGGLKAGILSKDLMKLPRDASAIPCLEQFISENRNIPKNVVVVALTNLKRSRRYKQALEVSSGKSLQTFILNFSAGKFLKPIIRIT
jgi:hypothetical protein